MSIERQHDRFLKARTLASARGPHTALQNGNFSLKNQYLLLRIDAKRTLKPLRGQGRFMPARHLLVNAEDLTAIARHNTQGTTAGSTGLLEQRT
jgi:hypothetical protein